MYTYITTTIRRHNWFRWTLSFDYLVVTLSNWILLFFFLFDFLLMLWAFLFYFCRHNEFGIKRGSGEDSHYRFLFWLLLNLTFTTHTRTRKTLSWFLLFQKISFVLFFSSIHNFSIRVSYGVFEEKNSEISYFM